MNFKIEGHDAATKARAGSMHLAHGVVKTPIFMPVGTAGTVKGVFQQDLINKIKAEIILGNAYHLYLRPGLEVIARAGGLHKFIGWDRPLLTDSGGYQVHSLGASRKITKDKVIFQSHIDGSKHEISPEFAMDIQRIIGSDIMMAFDECTPFPCEYEYAKKSMHLTHQWLDRCCTHADSTHSKYGYEQTLFPIVQGSVFKDLRKESAIYIANKNREGNAIGGLSVGEPPAMMYDMCQEVCKILPSEKPRYLMGVGTPANLLECIGLGIDMFDCVIPTRNGRNGMLFTSKGIINIKNKKWKYDFEWIDDEIDNGVSNYFTKAYLRHLIMSQELLGAQIASLHNLSFYLFLVKVARERILEKKFSIWKNEAMQLYMKRL